MSLFRFSAYWGTWSLVLTDNCQAKPGYGPFVEIDLTPINGWGSTNLDRVRSINVRRHCTGTGARDILTGTLPAHVLADMRRHLGDELVDWLVDPRTEMLGKIDWQRFNEVCNGGASLYDIVHDRYLEQLPARSCTTQERIAA